VEELSRELVAKIDFVLDGGPTPGALPSTIVAVHDGQPRLVRAGAIPWDEVVAAAA
jgi:L-threonylcarbamoyladenylate synthase